MAGALCFAVVVAQGRGAPEGKSQLHRCRFCKQEGHNIRSCEALRRVNPDGNPRQTCGVCGKTGHNRRNCPQIAAERCEVCGGSQRVVCKACMGCGTMGGAANVGVEHDAFLSSPQSGPLGKLYNAPASGEKDVLLMRARERVRQHMERVHQTSVKRGEMDVLIGAANSRAVDKCNVCQGKGYLVCLSCSL